MNYKIKLVKIVKSQNLKKLSIKTKFNLIQKKFLNQNRILVRLRKSYLKIIKFINKKKELHKNKYMI